MKLQNKSLEKKLKEPFSYPSPHVFIHLHKQEETPELSIKHYLFQIKQSPIRILKLYVKC